MDARVDTMNAVTRSSVIILVGLMALSLFPLSAGEPSIESVSLSPEFPVAGDSISCERINQSSDTVMIYYIWYSNTTVVLEGWEESILPGANVTAGASIRVEAVPSNGTANGTMVSSDTITVGEVDPQSTVDTDGDGWTDDVDIDDDDDYFFDEDEINKYGTDPLDPQSHPPDNDEDRIADDEDTDDDNDGVMDDGLDGQSGTSDDDAFPTDPAVAHDTDGDGKPDDWLDGKSAADSTSGFNDSDIDEDDDGDGMPDQWELAHGLNPLYPGDATQDLDSDGVSNIEEFEQNTDPSFTNDLDIGSDENGIGPFIIPIILVVLALVVVIMLIGMKRKGEDDEMDEGARRN